MRNLVVGVIAVTLVSAVVANAAAEQIFFGEDLGLGESTRLTSHPNADAARDSFLAGLTGVGTEDFESFATGTSLPITLDFGAAGSATLDDGGYVAYVPTGTNGVGRYPISGDKYLETGTDLVIDFTEAQAAFGFYGVDIGDFNGQVVLTFTNGGSEVVNIGNSTGISGGSVLYFGIIVDEGNEFTKIQFDNTASGTDYFGFDDMTIGIREQVEPANPIPAPSTLVGLLSMGAAGLMIAWRKRKR
jgi:hypothetical protein